MPGLAQSNSFLLSTATVMIGPLDQLNQLNRDEHSIGLVKNFQMQMDPSYVELTQGISNTVVMSVRNQDGLKASMEVYEYTLRNLSYAAGLDGTGVDFDPITETFQTTASAEGGASDVTVSGDATDDISAGDYIFIQAAKDDQVHIAKVASATMDTTDTTITLEVGYETPTGVTYPTGSRVGRVKRTDIATGSVAQPEFAAKIVGLLPKNQEPFTILIPKLKITRGMSVAFQSDNFGNLPFEFTPYNSVPTDPMYGEYGAAAAVLFPR